MLGKYVLAKDFGSAVVQLEHRFVELQNVFGSNVGFARSGAPDKQFQIGRQVVGSYRGKETKNLANKYYAVNEVNGRFFHALPLPVHAVLRVRPRSTAGWAPVREAPLSSPQVASPEGAIVNGRSQM